MNDISLLLDMFVTVDLFLPLDLILRAFWFLQGHVFLNYEVIHWHCIFSLAKSSHGFYITHCGLARP